MKQLELIQKLKSLLYVSQPVMRYKEIMAVISQLEADIKGPQKEEPVKKAPAKKTPVKKSNPADVNNDGVVDEEDIKEVANAMAKKTTKRKKSTDK